MIDAYETFLREKAKVAANLGFEIEDSEIHPICKPHQRDIIRWAVRGGRRGIFASYGLGKSVIQLEIGRLTLKCAGGGRALIICPLGVRREFKHDAAMVGQEIAFVKRTAEVGGDGLYLTNYESVRDGKIDVGLFTVVLLDEASVLRSYGSKTYQTFLALFDKTPYRFVATATPSPNRIKEIIHYAGFLGVSDTGQVLTRFFQRDSTQANNLTLFPHKTEEFWFWVSSWAVFLSKPSDLGHDDTGYDLPPVEVIFHELPATSTFGATETNGQTTIMTDAALSLSTSAREKRDSLLPRINKAAEIMEDGGADTHWIMWHTLEGEREAIERRFPDAGTVYGTQDEEEQEQVVSDFAEGRLKVLAGKPVMLGQGVNFQRHCHSAIFLGVDYKANDLMQAVHRIQRFQQQHPVQVHLIHTETERQIVQTLMHKWETHKKMVQRMTDNVRRNGLGIESGLSAILKRSLGIDRVEVSSDLFRVANNDAVLEARRTETNSVGQIITSIPFSNHYEYSPSYNDFGHTDNNDHFWAQMDYLTPELLRILQPGRIACIHVKDRILFGNVTGTGLPTVSPFHCEAIMHYRKHGFDFLGMVTIVTDVVRENNQTYRLGWTENSKDGTKMGFGSPEYVIVLHKPQSDRSKGYADIPVSKNKADYTRARWQVDAHAFWRTSGDRLLTADEMASYGPAKLAKMFTEYSLENIYDYEFHVRIGEELEAKGALPSSFMSLAPGSWQSNVWTDINRMITLNSSQAAKGKEAHVCPLQTEIVDRLIERYSNPGDVVYDPFMGLGTVAVRAIKLGRRGQGSELNAGYFLDSVQYCRASEAEASMPTLFDFEDLRPSLASDREELAVAA